MRNTFTELSVDCVQRYSFGKKQNTGSESEQKLKQEIYIQAVGHIECEVAEIKVDMNI